MDLQGMRRGAMSLKRNDGARKRILIAPSRPPHPTWPLGFFLRGFLSYRPEPDVGFAPNCAVLVTNRQYTLV